MRFPASAMAGVLCFPSAHKLGRLRGHLCPCGPRLVAKAVNLKNESSVVPISVLSASRIDPSGFGLLVKSSRHGAMTTNHAHSGGLLLSLRFKSPGYQSSSSKTQIFPNAE
jgi:hypothetical protein